MSFYYLTPWTWFDNGDDQHWHIPNVLGSIDLRSIPQMSLAGGTPQGFGIAVYSTPQVIPDALEIGDDLNRSMSKSRAVVSSFLGMPNNALQSSNLRGAIYELLLMHGDPRGQTRWKPLRARFSGVRLMLAGEIKTEVFSLSHRTFQNTIDIFKVDYREHKQRISALPAGEADTRFSALRRYTGWMLRTYRLGTQVDAILPSEHVRDGFETPRTTITDTFDTNGSLDNGPWDEVRGVYEVISNEVVVTTGESKNGARHTTDLSTDDHKASVSITALNASNGKVGPSVRNSTDAPNLDDHYKVGAENSASLQLEFLKLVNGTNTVIDTNQTVTISLPQTIECEASASNLKSRYDGTLEHDFTDTVLTGQVRVGAVCRRDDNDKFDDFSAEDLAVGAIVPRSIPRAVFRGVTRAVA